MRGLLLAPTPQSIENLGDPCTGRKWPKHNGTRHFLLAKHKALGAARHTKKASVGRRILAHFQEARKYLPRMAIYIVWALSDPSPISLWHSPLARSLEDPSFEVYIKEAPKVQC